MSKELQCAQKTEAIVLRKMNICISLCDDDADVWWQQRYEKVNLFCLLVAGVGDGKLQKM